MQQLQLQNGVLQRNTYLLRYKLQEKLFRVTCPLAGAETGFFRHWGGILGCRINAWHAPGPQMWQF